MIVEMEDYAWSEHIVTVFLACQITIKNLQVQLTVKGKTTPDSLWDFIGRKINQRNLKCQTIDELRTAILQEWQQFPQERLRCLVRSMTRRVTELQNKRGGYTLIFRPIKSHTCSIGFMSADIADHGIV
jgi:hypothetical protein